MIYESVDSMWSETFLIEACYDDEFLNKKSAAIWYGWRDRCKMRAENYLFWCVMTIFDFLSLCHEF